MGHVFTCREGLVDPDGTGRCGMKMKLFSTFLTTSCCFLKPTKLVAGLTQNPSHLTGAAGYVSVCICSSSPIHTPCYRSCLTCLRHNGSHKSPAGSQDEDRLGYSQCCYQNTREFFPLLPSCNSISVIGRQNGFTSLRVHSTGAESCSTGGESSVLNVVADRNH